jgi:hypothetical protein
VSSDVVTSTQRPPSKCNNLRLASGDATTRPL